MPTNAAYRIPGVSGTVTSTRATGAVTGGRRMSLVGTAGSGPDIPTEYPSAAAALLAYGSPGAGATGTLAWGILAAMSANPAGGAAAPLVVGRSGVTRASLALPATAGAGATLYGIGAFLGDLGNGPTTNGTTGLSAVVTAGTVGGTYKVVVNQGKGTGLVILATYDNLLTGQGLVNALTQAGDTTVVAVAGPGTGICTPLPVASLAGGASGLAATGADYTAMMALLFSGLVTAPRYLCVLADAQAVQASVIAALAAAAGGVIPRPCMAFLGNALGTTVAAAAALAQTINTPGVDIWGNDGAYRYDPVVNVARPFDGFYQAATLMGLKAALPVERSLINQTLSGWGKLNQIPAGSLVRDPTLADVSLLGAAGASYGLYGPGYSGLQIIDSLTTASQVGANAYQSQPGMLDSLYEAQTRAYAAAQVVIGDPAPVNNDRGSTLASAISAALLPLVGGALASVDSVTALADPLVLGRYIPQIGVTLRQTMRYVDFTFSVTF